MDLKEAIRKERMDRIHRLIDSYVDRSVIIPEGFPLAFQKTVIIKQASNANMMKTNAGFLLIESSANNHLIPNIGHVYAVGPECSEHIKVGLRVFFNQFANLEVMIKGEVYMIIDEREVYGALPDSAFVRMDTLTDKEVSRKEGLDRQITYQENKFKQDQEIKDDLDFLGNGGKH